MFWADFYLGLRLRLEPGEQFPHPADGLPKVRCPQPAMRREQERADRAAAKMLDHLVSGRNLNLPRGDHCPHNRGGTRPSRTALRPVSRA